MTCNNPAAEQPSAAISTGGSSTPQQETRLNGSGGLADNQGLINEWGAQADAEPDKLASVKAEKLADDPNKLEKLLDIFERRHIGDRAQAHLCLLCALFPRVVAEKQEGTQVVISGERGAGKTDFADTIAKLVPEKLGGRTALISGGQSDKFITRALEAGLIGSQCVMIFDDTFKSEAAALWWKQLTAWDTPHTYYVLESDGKGFAAKPCPLPQKVVMIRVSVDDIRDEQENNRALNLHLSRSSERDYAIREHIRQTWSGKDTEEIENEFFVVQRMWELLPPEVTVTFPAPESPDYFYITGGDEGDKRLYKRIYSLIASQAAFRAGKGQTEITATREDAEPVVRLMNEYLAGKTGGGAEGMDAAPLEVLNALLSRGNDFEGSVTELMEYIGINDYGRVHRSIYGRKKTNGTYTTGLIHLGYVTDEEETEVTTIQSGGGYENIPTKRRSKRNRIIHFDYAAAQRKRGNIVFVVSPSI